MLAALSEEGCTTDPTKTTCCLRLQVPFFVGLTAGTTVTGAFDPIPPVLALARKHGLWVHVDGSWGAAALLSPEHRSLLQVGSQNYRL